jgi:hypothetical protein
MKLSPFWYAVGSVFAVPLCVIVCLVWCGFILLVWPTIPFLFYYNRKKELSVAQTENWTNGRYEKEGAK